MISQALPARGFPLFAGIRLPPVNQGTVRSENDRNFPTQRNLLKRGPINQAGKKKLERRESGWVHCDLGDVPHLRWREMRRRQAGSAPDLKAVVQIEATQASSPALRNCGNTARGATLIPVSCPGSKMLLSPEFRCTDLPEGVPSSL